MNRQRVLSAVLAAAALLGLAACEPTGVGDPCTPEVRPPEGQAWAYGEVSVETRSLQCRTRTCMVYHFFPAGRELGEPDWRREVEWPVRDDPQEPCRSIETEDFVKHFCKTKLDPVSRQNVIDMSVPFEHEGEWYCNFDMTLVNLSRPFCTYKCAGAGRTFECPEGFLCREVVRMGPEGMRGSYCIPSRLADCDRFTTGEQDCCQNLRLF
ncbi:MAG: hypothetical protein JXB32_17875 [Deltaproteobacteria bacterium]|nr:hypothetical protein [Deltaproteobacteria bacterium]